MDNFTMLFLLKFLTLLSVTYILLVTGVDPLGPLTLYTPPWNAKLIKKEKLNSGLILNKKSRKLVNQEVNKSLDPPMI